MDYSMRPLLLLIVVVEIMLLHGVVVYAAQCKDGEPCRQVGSSLYPISASASLGALGNVTLSQAGADKPVRINVAYDDTGSFLGAMGAFKVYIAAEPIDRVNAGMTLDECRGALTTMYDPDKRAPPHVEWRVYKASKGCDGSTGAPDQEETRAREEVCALGDLSGKHGSLPGPSGTRTIEDRSRLSVHDVIGRAFVLVNEKSESVACANIAMNIDDVDSYNKPQLLVIEEEPPADTVRALSEEDLSRSTDGGITQQCSIPTPKCTSGQQLSANEGDAANTRSEDVTRIMSPEPIEVKRGAYPWIVHMSVCSGTLIAPTVILTAAHCVAPHGGKNSIRLGQAVYMGCTDVSNKACQESGRITGIFAHEKYKDASLEKHAYDIAVLILEKPSRVPVATLATREDDPAYCATSLSTVAGWGKDGNGQRSEALLQVNVPVTSHESCEKAWGKGRIGPTMICAGFDDGGCDACQGDSGGPIFTSTRCAPPDTPPRVFGIVSWGAPCDKANRKPYGVYTSVASVRDWIASKMPGGELADPDERVLPYVVRSIDQ